MKNSDLNKMLGIGPYGINCGCCVDYSKKKKKSQTILQKIKKNNF